MADAGFRDAGPGFPNIFFEDFPGFPAAPVAAHKQVQQLVCIPVYFLELPDCVEFLPNNLGCAAERDGFRDRDFEGPQAFGYGGPGNPQAPRSFRTSWTMLK